MTMHAGSLDGRGAGTPIQAVLSVPLHLLLLQDARKGRGAAGAGGGDAMPHDGRQQSSLLPRPHCLSPVGVPGWQFCDFTLSDVGGTTCRSPRCGILHCVLLQQCKAVVPTILRRHCTHLLIS